MSRCKLTCDVNYAATKTKLDRFGLGVKIGYLGLRVDQFAFDRVQLRFLVAVLVVFWGTQASANLELIEPAVAYQPRYYDPGSITNPLTIDQIVDDLRLLRELGFRSLVTYGSDGVLAKIPAIARQEGFDGTIIMGIWNPLSEEELKNASAQKTEVDGYSVGNEGLDLQLYDTVRLAQAMQFLRQSTGRPVTTTEPIDSYLSGPHRNWLLENSDWLFPTAHPFWAVTFDPQRAADWIFARHDLLAATSTPPLILKEVGFPTWCEAGCSEEEQMMLFQTLRSAGLSFMYFEAFDQPWKSGKEKYGDAEAHWGLFDEDGDPKMIANWLKSEVTE